MREKFLDLEEKQLSERVAGFGESRVKESGYLSAVEVSVIHEAVRNKSLI